MLSLGLISSDRVVLEICDGVLEQLGSERCVLRLSAGGGFQEPCDIYVWDSESVPKLPASFAVPDDSTKLVIVRKALLQSIRARLPHENFVFLHHPVSKLTLRVFLESTIAHLELARKPRNGPEECVETRDRILQKLLETNLKLQEYDTERTSFLTRAVHDIRAPLMAIQGYCGLLLAGQFGVVNEEQIHILGRMQRSITRLAGLAEVMMELGVGGGAVGAKVKLDESCLEECIKQAVHEIRPFTNQKAIDVALNLEGPAAPLFFDSVQMEQVLVNLLDNGCRFTPRRGSIRIHGYSVAPHQVTADAPFPGYRLDIIDSGPGIPIERMDRVFDEYTSYGGPTDRSGAGLGLAICRMIVNAHNGRIWATSRAGGATFSILLPYPRTHVDRQPVLQAMRAAV